MYHAQLQDAEPMRSEMDTSKLSSSRASQLLSRYAEVEAFDTWDNLQDPLALAIDPGLYGCDSCVRPTHGHYWQSQLRRWSLRGGSL